MLLLLLNKFKSSQPNTLYLEHIFFSFYCIYFKSSAVYLYLLINYVEYISSSITYSEAIFPIIPIPKIELKIPRNIAKTSLILTNSTFTTTYCRSIFILKTPKNPFVGIRGL